MSKSFRNMSTPQLTQLELFHTGGKIPVHLQLLVKHGTAHHSAPQWSWPSQLQVQMKLVLQQNSNRMNYKNQLCKNKKYLKQEQGNGKVELKPASRKCGTISLQRLNTSSNPLQNLSSGQKLKTSLSCVDAAKA